jgi:hypothetical protein
MMPRSSEQLNRFMLSLHLQQPESAEREREREGESVCVREGEREGAREAARVIAREREKERERERKKKREREKEKERKRERARERESERGGEREKGSVWGKSNEQTQTHMLIDLTAPACPVMTPTQVSSSLSALRDQALMTPSAEEEYRRSCTSHSSKSRTCNGTKEQKKRVVAWRKIWL